MSLITFWAGKFQTQEAYGGVIQRSD